MLVDFWVRYIGFPIVFSSEYRVVINIWRHGPISFSHVSMWCSLFDPNWTTYQSNKGPIKETSQLRSIYLQHDDLDSCELTDTSHVNRRLKVADMSTGRCVVVLSQLCFSKPILGDLSRLWHRMILLLFYFGLYIISCIFIGWMNERYVCMQ